MIVSAHISHYKSISDAALKFGPVTIIVGPNGSGKSNILDAIYFLHDCSVNGIDNAITKRHGIDSLRQWSRTKPYNITIELSFHAGPAGRGSYKVVLSSVKGQYRIIEETAHWTGRHPRRVLAKDQTVNGHSTFIRNSEGRVEVTSTFRDLAMDRPTSIDNNELFLTNLNRRVAVPPFIMFRSIFDELSSFAKYNIYPNTLRTPQLVSREGTLEEDGSNLASVLKRINTAKRFGPNKDDILTGIRQIMPMISDFQIRSAAGFYVPVLRVTESSGEIHDFNLSQISDGTLRVLGLLAAFYQPFGPTKIGIEEPELMIHPGALQVVAEAIRDFTRERPDEDSRQAFITTHSPTFLDSFDPREIIWARFESGVTKSGTVSARQTELIKTQLFFPGEILLSEGFFS